MSTSEKNEQMFEYIIQENFKELVKARQECVANKTNKSFIIANFYVLGGIGEIKVEFDFTENNPIIYLEKKRIDE